MKQLLVGSFALVAAALAPCVAHAQVTGSVEVNVPQPPGVTVTVQSPNGYQPRGGYAQTPQPGYAQPTNGNPGYAQPSQPVYAQPVPAQPRYNTQQIQPGTTALYATGPQTEAPAAPPVMLVEAPTPSPGNGYVWTHGYWAWNGSAYAWAPGHWAAPPSNGYGWVAPQWQPNRRGRWRFVPGRWQAGIAVSAPPPVATPMQPQGPQFAAGVAVGPGADRATIRAMRRERREERREQRREMRREERQQQ